MTRMRHRWIIFLAGAGLTLLAAGLAPFVVFAQDATPEPTPGAAATLFYDPQAAPVIEPSGDNSYCAVCHNQPLQTVTLRDGQILNLYVSPEQIANSVHGSSNPQGQLGCVDCHGAASFPHAGPTPVDQRAYSLQSVNMCLNCHIDQVNELQNGLHEQAIALGESGAAVCTDCHGAHDIQPVARFPELVAGVCGDCHTSTLAEWRASAHLDIGPLDCATCHSPHTQRMRGGLTSNDLCVNCHKELPELWVHTQHATTDSEVGCIDCHMHVEDDQTLQPVVFEPGQTPTGHTMLVDTLPCTACHAELTASDPTPALAEATTTDDAAPEQEQTAEATSFVQLIQGMILGLGFGITGAAIFVSRGNRLASQAARHEE